MLRIFRLFLLFRAYLFFRGIFVNFLLNNFYENEIQFLYDFIIFWKPHTHTEIMNVIIILDATCFIYLYIFISR